MDWRSFHQTKRHNWPEPELKHGDGEIQIEIRENKMKSVSLADWFNGEKTEKKMKK